MRCQAMDKRAIQVGDTVRYIGPSLFRSGAHWTGRVVRMPICNPGPNDRNANRALVQVGAEMRPRPVRVSDLALLTR